MLELVTSSTDDFRRRHSPCPDSAKHSGPPDFVTLYNTWYEVVTGWLQTLGAPVADIEDLAQDVFLVVRRRLCDFDGRNVAGWLFRISSRQVLQHRRRRWVQSVIMLEAGKDIEDVPDDRAGVEEAFEVKEKGRQLLRLIGRMSEKRRVAFMLFEVEDYTGEDIADMLSVPINTVWTRLHHARRDFSSMLAQQEESQSEVT
jgi:RNA polymerase sigma-70 factor (ECF subfamily)